MSPVLEPFHCGSCGSLLASPSCAGTGRKQGTAVPLVRDYLAWSCALRAWGACHTAILQSWEHCQMPIEPWGTIPVVLGQRQSKTVLVGKMQQCAGHPGWLCIAIPALTADVKLSGILGFQFQGSNLILENSAPIQFTFSFHEQRQDGQWREDVKHLTISNVWGEGQKLLAVL